MRQPLTLSSESTRTLNTNTSTQHNTTQHNTSPTYINKNRFAHFFVVFSHRVLLLLLSFQQEEEEEEEEEQQQLVLSIPQFFSKIPNFQKKKTNKVL